MKLIFFKILAKLNKLLLPSLSKRRIDLTKITLMEKNIEFEEINIKDNAQALAMLRLKNLRTVPQIWDGELYIGGYNELKEHIISSESA